MNVLIEDEGSKIQRGRSCWTCCGVSTVAWAWTG
jgi:hypothetical protein